MATLSPIADYIVTGTMVGIRPWDRRRDRHQIDRWPTYAPALPIHWTTAPVPTSPDVERVSFAVDLLSSLTADRLIGRISLCVADHSAVIGIVLHPDHLGIGIGTESLITFADVARARDLVILHLNVAVDNIRAIRCYQRARFVSIGEMWRNGHNYVNMARGLT